MTSAIVAYSRSTRLSQIVIKHFACVSVDSVELLGVALSW